jgi:hypothetical protein
MSSPSHQKRLWKGGIQRENKGIAINNPLTSRPPTPQNTIAPAKARMRPPASEVEAPERMAAPLWVDDGVAEVPRVLVLVPAETVEGAEMLVLELVMVGEVGVVDGALIVDVEVNVRLLEGGRVDVVTDPVLVPPKEVELATEVEESTVVVVEPIELPETVEDPTTLELPENVEDTDVESLAEVEELPEPDIPLRVKSPDQLV